MARRHLYGPGGLRHIAGYRPEMKEAPMELHDDAGIPAVTRWPANLQIADGHKKAHPQSPSTERCGMRKIGGFV